MRRIQELFGVSGIAARLSGITGGDGGITAAQGHQTALAALLAHTLTHHAGNGADAAQNAQDGPDDRHHHQNGQKQNGHRGIHPPALPDQRHVAGRSANQTAPATIRATMII